MILLVCLNWRGIVHYKLVAHDYLNDPMMECASCKGGQELHYT